MASLTDSLLIADISDIINQQGKSFYYTFAFHTRNNEYPALRVETLDVVKDYHKGLYDVIQIRILINLGEYVHNIFPNQRLSEGVLTMVQSEGMTQARYRILFPEHAHGDIDPLALISTPKHLLDQEAAIHIDMQLIPLPVEAIGLMTVGGVYKDMTVTECLLKAAESTQHTVKVRGRPIITEMLIEKADNDFKYSQIVVPSNTRLLDLPTFLQERYGLYSTGIGRYLRYQGGSYQLSVYPLYRTKRRYELDVNKLRIYVPLRVASRGYLNSFTVEDLVVNIHGHATTGDTGKALGRNANQAVANTYRSPTNILDDDMSISGGTATMPRDSLQKSFTVTSRDDGLMVEPGKTIQTDNPYKLASDLAQNSTTVMSFLWKHAVTGHLKPGMPVRIYRELRGAVYLFEGTLLHAHGLSTLTSSNLKEPKHTNMTTLTIAVNQRIQDE